MPIRVLLADDSNVVRQEIRRVLADRPEIQLIGEATDFAQLFEMTNDLTPDVILMDLHMPGENVVDLMSVKSLLNHGSRISRILAMSLSNDEDANALAQTLGAVSLLDKAELFTTLIPAIVQLAGNAAEQAC